MPESMRAIVFRGLEDVEIATLPVPPLSDRDVLVRVAGCGVCGTDLHIVFGPGGWGVPGSVYGHEWSGEVVAVGPDVTRLHPGDAVVGAERSCGRCEFCVAGRPSLCTDPPGSEGPHQGGFAEYVKEHEDALVPVPTGLDLRAAALAEPLAVAMHGVTRSKASPGQRVLITGGGPIGLLTLAALTSRGIEDVVVSEPASARRARATELGAAVTHPSELAPVLGYMDVAPEPFDVVIECSGTVAATTQGLTQLRPGGRLVIVGSNFDTVPLDPLRVLVQELVIVGSRQYDADGFEEALSLLQARRVPWDRILEAEDVPFSGFTALLNRMRQGEVAGKPLVVAG